MRRARLCFTRRRTTFCGLSRELYEALGDRKASICRELTKKYETAFRTTLSQAVAYYTENEPKGECVIVIEGKAVQEIEAEDQARWQQMSLEEHMEHYESQGNSRKEAMKLVAKDRGVFEAGCVPAAAGGGRGVDTNGKLKNG